MAVALGWVAFGLAVAVGAWRMDRLEHLHVEPWSAPGLVPGVLGVLIVLFGAVLAWRERRAPAGGDPGDPGDGPRTARRVTGVLVLCAAFAFGLLGRGLPFVATSASLVLAWIAWLRWAEWRAEGRLLPGLAGTAAIALGACFAIAHLFEDVFLVRLP